MYFCNASTLQRWKAFGTVLALVLSAQCFAVESEPATSAPIGVAQPPEGRHPEKEAPDSKTRNFYSVLEDLMADFEYDLKNNEVSGLKDLAIRNVAMSENVPPSFKYHLELLVTERILKNSHTRVIQCLPCRAKRTTLDGDQVVVTSAESNPAELARIAKLSNIQHFMDIAFAYQPTGMALSMYTTDPESGSIVWSRSYNSENSRAAALRRGVDYSQTEEARKMTEYVPVVQYRFTAYFLFEPNTSSQSTTLGLGYRMMERYDNRKKEVGFELDYLKDSSSLSGSSSTTTRADVYGGFNLTLLFMHAWNLIGEEENYNKVRGSIFGGIGGTYASGYLGGLLRGGYEWRLGKRFTISADLGYRPKTTMFIAGSSAGSVGGMEYGIGISTLF